MRSLIVILLLSSFLSAQETTTRLEPQPTTNNAIQVLSGPLAFESNKIYYVHREALEGVTQLTLSGLENTWIHFIEGPDLIGNVTYWTTYGDDVGVLNVVDCQNVTISGLDVTNTHEYSPGNIVLETGVAVNVSRSVATFKYCTLTAEGKCAFMVHSGSNVTIEDSEINGYYFEIAVGGSNVTAKRMVINQDHVDPDSHSAIWVGSSIRNGVTNVLYENTTVTIEDSLFDMRDGRSLVSGNGSYTTRSVIHLNRIGLFRHDQTFGLVAWHENYNSITVTTEDSVWSDDIVDYVSTPNTGFGKFVNYYTTPTSPNSNSPIIVDGLSSENVDD